MPNMFRYILILLLFISGCASFSSKTPVDEVKILFCGDMMMDWGIKEAALREGYDYPLDRVQGFLSTFDFRICNLECPIAPSGIPDRDKKYIFIAPPDAVKILTHGGINGVSLANNHTMDFGIPALQATMSILTGNKIQYTGAGNDADEARQPILLERNGIRIAVIGCTNIGDNNAYAARNTPGIARAGLESIKKDVQGLKKFNDFVIVSIHWGDEYADYPSEEQADLAHAIIDGGADGIIGHHSHIYQGIEIYRGRPVCYSLGNFLFGSRNEDIRDNIVVALSFKKSRMKTLEIHALNGINDTEHSFQPRKMSGAEAESPLSHLKEISRPLNADFPRGCVISNSRLIYTFRPEAAH